MKNLFTVLLFGSFFYSPAQDTIITKNSTIICKVTKVTSMNIFYTENSIGKNIEKSEVKYFTQHKPEIPESEKPPKLPIDSMTGNVCYSEVVKMDSVKKEELYLRANQWFAKSYKSANNVIQLNDKQAGQIIGKGVEKVDTKYNDVYGTTNLHYTITISLKDGRYKYDISQLYYHPSLNISIPIEETIMTYDEHKAKTMKQAKEMKAAWAISDKQISLGYHYNLIMNRNSDTQIKQLIGSLKTGLKTPSVNSSEW